MCHLCAPCSTPALTSPRQYSLYAAVTWASCTFLDVSYASILGSLPLPKPLLDLRLPSEITKGPLRLGWSPISASHSTCTYLPWYFSGRTTGQLLDCTRLAVSASLPHSPPRLRGAGWEGAKSFSLESVSPQTQYLARTRSFTDVCGISHW